MEVADKTSAINELIGHVSKTIRFNTTIVTKMLHNREQKRSSGCGKQVAFVHLISASIEERVIALATLKTPLEWDSIDKKPVKIIGLVLDNPKFMPEYFETITRYAELLANDTVRCSIISMNTVDQIFTVIHNSQV